MKKLNIAVVGAGLMGTGIATQFLLNRNTVLLHDIDAGRLHDAVGMVEAGLDELVEADILTLAEKDGALARLWTSVKVQDIAEAGIVIEAVPEILSLKRKIYHSIESVVSENTPIASNTSGFAPDLLCCEMAHPERFLIAHFWNPPYLLPLVELVPASTTSQVHVRDLEKLLISVGLTPVLLNKPIPGFIGNRIQFAILREVLHLLSEEIASPAQIDKVVQLTLGNRYQFAGPCASADLGGLNTLAEISKHLMPELAKDEDVIQILDAHVEQNETGYRSGRGFYEWSPERKTAVKSRKQSLLRSLWNSERKA